MSKTLRRDPYVPRMRSMVPQLRGPLGQRAEKRERQKLHGPVTQYFWPKCNPNEPVTGPEVDPVAARRDHLMGF